MGAPMSSKSHRKAESPRVDVVFEDEHVVVVDKPAGMIVHPAPGHEKGALTDILVASRPAMAVVGSESRPGIVHRLDIETSGIMVLAKTEKAYRSLRRAFESHNQVLKTYLAVLHGAISPRKGVLETLIGRKPWDPKRMAVVERDGARALTRWETLQKKGPISLVEFQIETGRMHQIRVHAAHLGHPIVGDSLYGERKLDGRLAIKPARQLLHAVELAFPHPSTGEIVRFAAPPPADIVYVR